MSFVVLFLLLVCVWQVTCRCCTWTSKSICGLGFWCNSLSLGRDVAQCEQKRKAGHTFFGKNTSSSKFHCLRCISYNGDCLFIHFRSHLGASHKITSVQHTVPHRKLYSQLTWNGPERLFSLFVAKNTMLAAADLRRQKLKKVKLLFFSEWERKAGDISSGCKHTLFPGASLPLP